MMRWLGCAGKDALVRMRFLSLNRTGSTPDDALVRAPPLHDALSLSEPNWIHFSIL
jgi:hypothetical protein